MGVNQNWGGTPQKSDTSTAQRPRWGDAPQKSDTSAPGGRAAWGDAPPQRSDTGAPSGKQAARSSVETPEYSFYILGRVSYRTVRLVSSESGQAKIFEIEANGKHYALKLYRHGIHPDHTILDKLMQLRGSGLLVDVYAHGIWHDDVQNADFDYEVMQLCTGGSLAHLQLHGNEDELKEIALRMTAAVDFLHRNGVVHRDVKPANFLFTDSSQKRFVLTDWGFARMLDRNGRAVADDGRTKLYTAPELYINIPGQPTYVDPKADFFSMGMSLLALWKGEGLLIADEDKLVRQKLDEELPYPSHKEMSEHMLSLIKALTRNNPDKRAGFDEVKRWAKGEVIFKDSADHNSLKDYRIVFSGEKNLIARNNAELARIMWQNRELAKKYLYADRIAEWLEDVDRPEVAMQMRDITEMRHPADRDTGLYAACMELDPSMPFTGIKGNPIRSQKELAAELYTHCNSYGNALGTTDHALWVFCNAVGLGADVKKYQRKSHPLKATYIREIAFLLDPSLPYPVPVVKDGKKSFVPVTSLDEYRKAFYSSEIWDNGYQNDPDFIAWARHCDAALVGHGLKLMDEAKNIEDVFTNTLMHFCLLPDIGFDGDPLATSDMSNPEQIARVLAAEICKEAEGKEFWDIIDWKVFDGSKLHAYLYVRGGFDTQCDWVTYCMDTKSTDAQKRTGPYNIAIAELKILAGWNGGSIPVTIEGITFTTPDDVANADLSGFSDREQTFLANWLTLKFQENPHADYSAKSYTNRTLEYYQFIRKHLPQCDYMTKGGSPDLEDALERNRKAWQKLRSVTALSTVFCLIPMLCVYGVLGYLAVTSASDTIVSATKSFGYGLAVLCGIIGALVCSNGGIIGMAIGGVLSFGITSALFTVLSPAMPWIILGSIVLIVIYFAFKLYGDAKEKPDTGSSLSWDETILRSHAGSAFNTHDKLLPNVQISSLKTKIEQHTKVATDFIPSLIKYSLWIWFFIACGLIICYFTYSPAKDEPEPDYQNIIGEYTGFVYDAPSKLTVSENTEGFLQAHMTIDKGSYNVGGTLVAKEKKSLPITLYRKYNDKITLTLKKDSISPDSVRFLNATYVDSNGDSQPACYFLFLSDL